MVFITIFSVQILIQVKLESQTFETSQSTFSVKTRLWFSM
jgi:hypothetical protein